MELLGYLCLELANFLLSYLMSSRTVSKTTRFMATMVVGVPLSLLVTMRSFNHSRGMEVLAFCIGLTLSTLLAYLLARFPCY